ncbi:hypothetical protein CEXT_800021 [Caerostris extrusa]|uniref:Uncharacterized protein n=1 Tax=Caerostris extrusa TaxID=172846 RepID=A0AAV4RGT2_CAEEX|nr:hypothetical protein CEXT_800021 [Caerostris extrusa]
MESSSESSMELISICKFVSTQILQAKFRRDVVEGSLSLLELKVAVFLLPRSLVEDSRIYLNFNIELRVCNVAQ